MTGCPFNHANPDAREGLNKSIAAVPLPARIAALPLDDRGYPVPFFASWIDGKADFRVVDPGKIALCHNKKRCWVCGGPMGAYKAFVIGPMCAVNRISSEPPSHLECGVYAAKACPFLTKPRMKRNEKDMPEGHTDPAGIMITRNPGVAMVWVTKQYAVVPDGMGGALFRVGDPENLGFYREGRRATLDEVLESIATGTPQLMAAAQIDGPEAIAQAQKLVDKTTNSIKALFADGKNNAD